MRKRYFVGAIITVLLATFGFTLIKLKEKGFAIQNRPSKLTVGEYINHFGLIDINGEHIDASVLRKKKPSLIFLFPRPCAPCSTDIAFWSRMALITQEKAQVFGIILGTSADVRELLEQRDIPFDLYFPNNLRQFLKKMKVGSVQAQTLLCFGGKVEMVCFDVMNGESYTEFLRRTMTMAKEQTEEKEGV